MDAGPGLPAVDQLDLVRAVNGKLYCAGGIHEGVETDAAYVYDPASRSWQSIAPMPVGLATAAYTAATGSFWSPAASSGSG